MDQKEKAQIRAARNAYQREWSRKNPDKVKAAQERYWLKRAREEGGADAEKISG